MKININGPIVPDAYAWIYDYFEEPYTSPKGVTEALAEGENEDVTVLINSGGGSVYAASEIYHALKTHAGKIRVEVVSIAASAASYVAMSGDEILISPPGQFMLHNASSYASGDYRDMDRASDMLKAVNASISKVYEMRTNLGRDEIKAMMDKETYLTAEEAVEKGFADRMLFSEEQQDFVASKGNILPKAVIDDMMKRFENGEFEDIQNSKDGNSAAEKEEGGEEVVDYEKIKNDFPEIFEKIKNEGMDEGAKNERARIQSIDALSQSGMEELVDKAKYEEPMDAGQLAIEILNKQKEVGQKHTKDVEDDAKDLSNVEDRSPDKSDEEKEMAITAKSAEMLEGIFGEGGVL